MPIEAPIVRPNEREMMKYAPPPSTLRLVAISEIASAVGRVTRWPISTIISAPIMPTWPTA